MNKGEMRKIARALRGEQTDHHGLVATIMRLDAYKSAENVMIYNAYGSEADISGLICAQTKNFLYPVCSRNHHSMLAATAPEGGVWDYTFGIKEPSLHYSLVVPADKIDLVLVPGLAFSKSGARLGQGGGYYDRFLPFCTNAVFVGVAAQIMDFEPEAHDIAMHIIATRQGAFFVG